MNCVLCGEPMPEGETMFKYHGYSGPCPKPPLPRPVTLADGLADVLLKHLDAGAKGDGTTLTRDQCAGAAMLIRQRKS